MSKPEPMSHEAERAVLGACLYDEHAVQKAAGGLVAEDFYRKSDQQTFATIVSLHETNCAVDQLTLVAAMREDGTLKAAGGAQAIAALCDAVPDVANIEHYIAMVREASARRGLIELVKRVEAETAGGKSTQALIKSTGDELAVLERKVCEAQFRRRASAIDAEQWATELASDSGRKGIRIGGIPGLGQIEGLCPQDLVVLAGRPGTGKSTFATQLTACATFSRGVPTLVVSSEMSRSQWGRWALAAQYSVTYTEVMRVPPRMIEVVTKAPIRICDSGTVSIAEIRRMAEGFSGVKLVIVDHIGRICGGRRENRQLEVGDVARGLKSIAKDLECTVLTLCQLNRAIEARTSKIPQLSDLRESGEIEQEADVVFFLVEGSDMELGRGRRPVSLYLKKYRFGALATWDMELNLPGRRFESSHQREE